MYHVLPAVCTTIHTATCLYRPPSKDNGNDQHEDYNGDVMAERFSRFRDAGTGIQVFLPPVPPSGQGSPLKALLLPVRVAVGLVRLALLLVVILAWSILNATLGNVSRWLQGVVHTLFGRAFLLVVGFVWITTETVSLRGRGRASSAHVQAQFNPSKGDLILCNWSSWVDVLLLLTAFNSTFAHPVVLEARTAGVPEDQQQTASATSRRKGAAARGQQHAQVPSTPQESPSHSIRGEERVLGWRTTSFLSMMLQSGSCPPTTSDRTGITTLDTILKSALGPVVVFPELTTSNNRGLLRFESILPHSWRSLYRSTGALRIGKGQPNVFIMSIKHDTPTSTTPSATLSVPSASPWSPLPHLLRLCFAPSTYGVQVRMLAEDESPTHASFAADANAAQRTNALSDKCADLMSSLSRLRRTDLGWQDKEVFLSMYRKR